jgi:hypothetical protein
MDWNPLYTETPRSEAPCLGLLERGMPDPGVNGKYDEGLARLISDRGTPEFIRKLVVKLFEWV